MARVVSIQFNIAGKMYDFNAGELELKPGDRVIVDTDKGASLGIVVTEPLEMDETTLPHTLSMVRRLLLPEDDQRLEQNAQREKEAHEFCLNRIKERNMDMKLVGVEYIFDGSQAIFFFTADGRVDFRELVKDLAHHFHTRIEMRQIGVRDEAKMVGGLGICGRELCCATFLRDFQPVSVKMAKEQNLALNPTKISGQCGRLLCCLDYEYQAYCDLRKNFPKCGKKACTTEYSGVVEKMNLLTGELTLRQDDGKFVNVRINELTDENTAALAARQREQQRNEALSASSGPKHQKQQAEPSSGNGEPSSVVKENKEEILTDEQQKQKKKKRSRRHGHRKNRENKNDSTSGE